ARHLPRHRRTRPRDSRPPDGHGISGRHAAPRMIVALLPLAVFLSAAACLAVELAIVRLGAPHVGQSLLPWTAAIIAVLLGLTLGHVLGGRAGGPQPPPARLLWLMA